MKVTVFSSFEYERPYLQKALAEHQLEFVESALSAETAHLAKGSQAVCLFTADDASAPVLEKLAGQGVKYIALRSVGFDHVDVPSAKKLGLRVANVPRYSPYSVAEHAFALLLACVRKIPLSQQLIGKQDFRLNQLVGFDLHGRTIGLIGTGKIGEAFAKIAHGAGCKLIAFDFVQNEELKKLTGLQYVSLDELCKTSDVISLHCPLNAETRHILNSGRFSQMKDGVVIINTARGAVIDTEALVAALQSGKVGAAGLDVYEFEKGLFFYDHKGEILEDALFFKLRSFDNVLITGHQAFLTQEALLNISKTTAENLSLWAGGKSSPNEL